MLLAIACIPFVCSPSVHSYSPLGQASKPVPLSAYSGKTILITNSASNDPSADVELAWIQKMYTQYNNRGLVVLAFPSNDFNGEVDLASPSGKLVTETTAKHHITRRAGSGVKVMARTGVTAKCARSVQSQRNTCSESENLFAALRAHTEFPPENRHEVINGNFAKYVVGKTGRVLYFSNSLGPDADSETRRRTERLLESIIQKDLSSVQVSANKVKKRYRPRGDREL